MKRYKEVLCRLPSSGGLAAIVLSLASVLTPAPLVGCDNTDDPGVLHGAWGGRGAQLNILGEFAEFEFDCAFGRVDSAIEVTPDGEFTVEGFYHLDRGGPGRASDPDPVGLPAIYSGFRNGAKIHLTIHLIDADRTVGPFVLFKSQKAELEKCL